MPEHRPTPVSRPRLYEQLSHRLCEFIAAEGLGPGDRLPPERELAGALGVSRASLSQALVAMEVHGIIEVRHGDGAVIRRSVVEEQVLAMLRDRGNRHQEIIEARQALEVKLAELAALRRDSADLAELTDAVKQMRAEIAAGGRGEGGDRRFHAAIARAARSGLLARMMSEIAPLVTETRQDSLAQPGRPPASLAGHEQIVTAISEGDAARAANAMHQHLMLVSELPI